MPIYTYFCKRCQKKFDLLVRSIEQKLICPDCGNSDLEKLFSTFGILKKGSSSESSNLSSSSKCSFCSGGNCSSCG